MSDFSSNCRRIEIEDRADSGEGKAVLGIGLNPLPCLAGLSRDLPAVGLAQEPFAFEAAKSILKDSYVQALQPTVCRRVDDLDGQDDGGDKQRGHVHDNISLILIVGISTENIRAGSRLGRVTVFHCLKKCPLISNRESCSAL